MLQPARRKYRKEQKGRNRGISHESGTSVSFGEYGLKAVGRGRLTARQIESARRAMTRHIKSLETLKKLPSPPSVDDAISGSDSGAFNSLGSQINSKGSIFAT